MQENTPNRRTRNQNCFTVCQLYIYTSIEHRCWIWHFSYTIKQYKVEINGFFIVQRTHRQKQDALWNSSFCFFSIFRLAMYIELLYFQQLSQWTTTIVLWIVQPAKKNIFECSTWLNFKIVIKLYLYLHYKRKKLLVSDYFRRCHKNCAYITLITYLKL